MSDPHGLKPRIDYAPGAVSDPAPVDIGDVHGLHDPVQGVGSDTDIPEGPSGIIADFELPAYDNDIPSTELPATSAVVGDVPWQSEPGRIPKDYVTPYEIFDAATGKPRRPS